MRVANQTLYGMVKQNLGNISEDLVKVNQIVSSGKRITNLSDDPVGLTQVLHIKATLSNMEQLGRNVTFGKSWLAASETALRNVQDLVSDTKAMAVQMATSTIGSPERDAAAENVQNTLEEIVSLANTDVGGRFIFAGSNTDNVPFAQDGTYNGDNNPFTIKVGQTTSVEVGKDGEAVFKSPGTDIFQILTDLKTALENNDVGGIQDAIGQLGAFFDYVNAQISDVGSKTLRMEVKENIFQDINISNTERLSTIEDADLAEAITDLKAKELAYQAALSSSSMIMGLSLVDYMK
jgi:flagellar hook-associated protein 3 FlgL